MEQDGIKDVVIVGLGAIGAVYAAPLSSCPGVRLRAAVDPPRLGRYHDRPLVFNGRELDLEYFVPAEGDSPVDLIIIATKSTGYFDALALIGPLVGDGTVIMPLLNGISSEEEAAGLYGWEHVIYAYFIGHTSTRHGRTVSQDGAFRTYFGEAGNTTLSPRIGRIRDLFDKAEIPYKIPGNMVTNMWQKYIINIGMNQATAILRCTYGHLRENGYALEYMVKLMDEAAAVGESAGIPGTRDMVEKAVSLLHTLGPDDGSSMYQDVVAGRPTEVDIFASTVCRLGREKGVPTPFNAAAEVILKALPLSGGEYR